MPGQEMDSLIEKGIRQGTVIPCSDLSDELCQVVSNSRAVVAARSRPCRPEDKLIVLSQDCDINSANEKYIEVVVAERPKARALKNNDQLKGARNTRKLHLLHVDEYRECHVQHISMVPKDALLAGADFSSLERLTEKSRELLLVWRINRYSRTPLPDAFNAAFIHGYLRRADVDLDRFLESLRDTINDLYVFVDPMEEGAENYRVSMSVLVDQSCSDEDFEQIQESMSTHLQALHKQENCLSMMQVDTSWIPEDIAHTLELVVRPDSFTMQDLGLMNRLSIDYLCFPEDGQGAQ